MIESALCLVSLLIGIFLFFRAMASLYAIIDHWYAIRVHYRLVGISIAVWCLTFIGLWLWLPDPFAGAYALGAACALAVHVFIAAFSVLLPRASGWWDEIEYRRFLKDTVRRRSQPTGELLRSRR